MPKAAACTGAQSDEDGGESRPKAQARYTALAGTTTPGQPVSAGAPSRAACMEEGLWGQAGRERAEGRGQARRVMDWHGAWAM
jgi:hypothetical protein